MAVKFTYVLDGKEVPEDVFALEHNKRRKRLERAGRKSPDIERTKDCKKAGVAVHSVMTAHDERYRKWYGEPPPEVIEDYRSEAAKRTWPRYKRLLTPHGWKEGPLRFKTFAEQNAYERAYGFEQETGKRSQRT